MALQLMGVSGSNVPMMFRPMSQLEGPQTNGTQMGSPVIATALEPMLRRDPPFLGEEKKLVG